MRIDFSKVLKGFDGEPIRDGDGNVITIGAATVIALTAPRGDDARLSGEDKFRRGQVAWTAWQSERNGQPADLSAEDVALVKNAIGQGWSTLVVWSAFRLIDEEL